MADGAGGGGGGGARGSGASPSRRDHHAHIPILPVYDNSEAYQGEYEDQELLSILLSEQEQPPLIQELFGQVTGEPAAPYQPDTAPADLLPEQEQAPLIQELLGQVTGEPAAHTSLILHPQTFLEDASLNAEVRDDNEYFLDIYSTNSTQNVFTAPIISEVNNAEITENEATLPSIMAPVEDAFTELDDLSLRAIRSSDREDAIVMVPLNMILVDQVQQNQGNNDDLSSCLREGQWDNALLLLEHMVTEGEAHNGAIQEGAPERDIYKAHPELVLWLRGQIYVDMLREGLIPAAEVYFRDYIADVYHDGMSTGSTFADRILGILKKIKRTGSPLRGSKAFVGRQETCKCVEDYLRVYFPGYRPQLRETVSRVWEFGEKEDGAVRCFLCHKEYRGLNLTKLERHLMGFGQGRQGKCPGVTIYVTQRLEQIQATEALAGSRRRGLQAVVPPPPPPPPPDAVEDAAAAHSPTTG